MESEGNVWYFVETFGGKKTADEQKVLENRYCVWALITFVDHSGSLFAVWHSARRSSADLFVFIGPKKSVVQSAPASPKASCWTENAATEAAAAAAVLPLVVSCRTLSVDIMVS